MSDATIGLSPDVRYSVILIASTAGSIDACRMNSSTDVANESYGWCTRMSPSRMTEKMLLLPSAASTSPVGVTGIHGSSFRSGRGSACTAHSPDSAERRVVERHVVGLEIELAQQQLEHLGRHAMVDLEAHGATEPATAQLHLDRGEQVVGLLLLEGEVGVARDAERHEVEDVHPGEERRAGAPR